MESLSAAEGGIYPDSNRNTDGKSYPDHQFHAGQNGRTHVERLSLRQRLGRVYLLIVSGPLTGIVPPGCPKTYQLLSFCHGERSRAISLNLQERVLRSLDCARDDRMIVSEEFSDNLPHIYFAWGRIAHFHIACHIPEEVEPRTSESFQLRTLNSFLLRTPNPFLPRTLGNRGEVEL